MSKPSLSALLSTVRGAEAPPPSASLSIDNIVDAAQKVERRIAESLPRATALGLVAQAVVVAARLAQTRIAKLKSPLSLTRIRRYLVASAIVVLAWWGYSNYLKSRTVTVAVTSADDSLLREKARRNNVSDIEFVDSEGSPTSILLVQQDSADMAVVQAGVEIPTGFANLGVVRVEHVLFLERKEATQYANPPRVITFGAGQGSQVLGELFFRRWGYPEVEWIHTWGELTTERDGHVIPQDVDAVFVVVDPADPSMQIAVRRIAEAGFVLRDPDIGVYATHLNYLTRIPVSLGYYHAREPMVPASPPGGVNTYTVDNYLVAGQGLTDRQVATALRAFGLDPSVVGLPNTVLHSPGSSIVADLDALLATTVNFVIVVFALFGLEVLLHRRYIHELNGLVSKLSLLQAEVDLINVPDKKTFSENIFYLDACADLLGLLSTIGGYYGQEDASLVFAGLTGLVHGRANDLKINIRLKLQNAGVMVDARETRDSHRIVPG